MPGRPSPKVKTRLIEVVPQQRLAWHGNAGADWLFAGDRELVIEAADGDAVRFTHVEDARGVLFPLFRLTMASAIQRHHDGLNTALKQRAEELAGQRPGLDDGAAIPATSADKRAGCRASRPRAREAELAQRVGEVVAGSGTADPLAALRIGADAWLDACTEEEPRRIVLLDGPSVLGWERWREIGLRHGVGLVETALTAAVDAGQLSRQPVQPLAHVLIGALDEAALYVATARDAAAARREVGAVLDRLLRGVA